MTGTVSATGRDLVETGVVYAYLRHGFRDTNTRTRVPTNNPFIDIK